MREGAGRLSRVPPATYLGEIVAAHRARSADDARDLGQLVAEAEAAPPPRGFRAALAAPGSSHALAVIAEVKRRSPSKGDLDAGLDPAAVALDYAAGGAACLSVLTDTDYFGAEPGDLGAARSACTLPVLRKDFTVSELDVCDARLMGADAVLLIVAALDDDELARFAALARDLSLDALVEVHDDAELERALHSGASLVGVNQRDLTTFEVDADRALRLAARDPRRRHCGGRVRHPRAGRRAGPRRRRLRRGAGGRDAGYRARSTRGRWPSWPGTGSAAGGRPVRRAGAERCWSRSAGSPARPTRCSPSPWARTPSGSSSPPRRARSRRMPWSASSSAFPTEVLTVGVFRNESKTRVTEIVNGIGLRAAQLHGDETPDDSTWVAERVPLVIKAFPVGHPGIRSIRRLRRRPRPRRRRVARARARCSTGAWPRAWSTPTGSSCRGGCMTGMWGTPSRSCARMGSTCRRGSRRHRGERTPASCAPSWSRRARRRRTRASTRTIPTVPARSTRRRVRPFGPPRPGGAARPAATSAPPAPRRVLRLAGGDVSRAGHGGARRGGPLRRVRRALRPRVARPRLHGARSRLRRRLGRPGVSQRARPHPRRLRRAPDAGHRVRPAVGAPRPAGAAQA